MTNKKNLDDILKLFDKNNIEINYDSDGIFSFTDDDELMKGIAVVEKVVGDSYIVDVDDNKIYLCDDLFDENDNLETDAEQDTYINKVKESYEKNEITKAEYLEFLENLENDLDSTEIEETYDKEELDKLVGKVYNLQKIQNIYRRTKYNDARLFAHTRCVNCGREKRVFLSNLLNDPDKYGSCVCSSTNIESRLDNIHDLFYGTKKLSTNTSGYTGVSFVKNYNGVLYNKWRAYIEINGRRTYLGDFDSKIKAVRARKAAALKGIKWYKENKNRFMQATRRKTKLYRQKRFK